MSSLEKNKNAQVREYAAESFLQCRVPVVNKSRWVKAAAARAQRLKGDPSIKAGLTQWVIDVLDAAAARELDS